MFRVSTLRTVLIAVLIVAATAVLSIAVTMQDHFLAFIALLACMALVGWLFRGQPRDDADEGSQR